MKQILKKMRVWLIKKLGGGKLDSSSTLSDLIVDCGNDIAMLQKVGDSWRAVSTWAAGEVICTGDTPEKAVAHLYLELNKK